MELGGGGEARPCLSSTLREPKRGTSTGGRKTIFLMFDKKGVLDCWGGGKEEKTWG